VRIACVSFHEPKAAGYSRIWDLSLLRSVLTLRLGVIPGAHPPSFFLAFHPPRLPSFAFFQMSLLVEGRSHLSRRALHEGNKASVGEPQAACCFL